MRWYIGRRVLQVIPVFLGATLLLYALVFLRPGDPVLALGGERGLPEAVQEQIRAEFHLDEPFLVQYLLYLKGIVTLDLGVTFTGREVTEVIAQALPVTFQLALMALAIEAVLGVGFGLLAGMRKGGLFDSTVLVLSLLVIAVPTFVLGFVLQIVVGVNLGWLPITAGRDPDVVSLLMPASVLAATSFAYVLRLTRTSVQENLSADFVRTARAKGLSRTQVTGRHVLRNSLIPVVTFLGADLGALMGGAIVTEGIFNIHGVGGTLYDAITRGENVTVVALTTVLVLVYIVANLAVDLLYAALDPRIRYA
ncbi:ABC transporter permease [Cellulomonas sp. zg-ZUI222]|uniref:ABC transporter permease n=1 Tax=Cellulomonas wangleii TaxID=2816956 RepID=A0ABX8D960_9CELL|nr:MULTISPECIES: ABC transporter permease [Cellulomonas]MBO0900422.1 ABC transporter permease [Cellulomonas sp. zg-ZUI22]MBO0922748.1 ABC transporter permease [Cellulomonas wangleii]MBO0926387.1 ABC transporter permease [Cellulomonas wangleii]QVI63936.1 ABC transporter permease [Cellulomonas wangleii]